MKDDQDNNLVEVDPSLLYECRFVILVETGPQSNKYVQLPLTLKQFVEISNFIGNMIGIVPVDREDTIKLPEEIKSWYEKK